MKPVDCEMITNHLIAQPHWTDISSEQLSSMTHPAVLCATIQVASEVAQGLFHALLPEEQQHALRFRQSDDRLRFVMGRALLRKLLGCYTKQGLEDIPFGQNAFGKPELLGYDSVPQFNVAHAGSSYSELLFVAMRLRGIHIQDGFPCFLTTAHTDEDIRQLIHAFEESVHELVRAKFIPTTGQLDLDNFPPIPNAKRGKDKEGNPAWFIEDRQHPGKYLQIESLI